MKLDYLDNVTGYRDNIVRLSDFGTVEAGLFRNSIEELMAGKKELDLATLEFIETINCSLVLRLAEEDLGISTEDNRHFFCDLTLPGFTEMRDLITPYCEKDRRAYQWLYDLDSSTHFLFSPTGSWEIKNNG